MDYWLSYTRGKITWEEYCQAANEDGLTEYEAEALARTLSHFMASIAPLSKDRMRWVHFESEFAQDAFMGLDRRGLVRLVRMRSCGNRSLAAVHLTDKTIAALQAVRHTTK
jgi:hypothetical protein